MSIAYLVFGLSVVCVSPACESKSKKSEPELTEIQKAQKYADDLCACTDSTCAEPVFKRGEKLFTKESIERLKRDHPAEIKAVTAKAMTCSTQLRTIPLTPKTQPAVPAAPVAPATAPPASSAKP